MSNPIKDKVIEVIDLDRKATPPTKILQKPNQNYFYSNLVAISKQALIFILTVFTIIPKS